MPRSGALNPAAGKASQATAAAIASTGGNCNRGAPALFFPFFLSGRHARESDVIVSREKSSRTHFVSRPVKRERRTSSEDTARGPLVTCRTVGSANAPRESNEKSASPRATTTAGRVHISLPILGKRLKNQPGSGLRQQINLPPRSPFVHRLSLVRGFSPPPQRLIGPHERMN